MKRAEFIGIAAVLLLAAPATAAEVDEPPYPAGSGTYSEPRTLDEDDGREPGGKEMRVRHVVRGSVSAIDNKTNVVTLATSHGELRLQFPDTEIRDQALTPGDQVDAKIAFWPGPPTQAQAGDAPGAPFTGDEFTHTGAITGVDADRGMLMVRTDAGQDLKLRFPSEHLRALKVKDRVTVEMSLDEGAADRKLDDTAL